MSGEQSATGEPTEPPGRLRPLDLLGGMSTEERPRAYRGGVTIRAERAA